MRSFVTMIIISNTISQRLELNFRKIETILFENAFKVKIYR